MVVLAATSRLWESSEGTASGSQNADTPGTKTLRGVPPEGPQTPICCWNLCASFGGVKVPRPLQKPETPEKTATFRAESPINRREQVFTPQLLQDEAVRFEGSAHLTSRLLVETISPGRHVVFNPLSGAVDLVDDAGRARLQAIGAGKDVVLSEDEERVLRHRRYLFDTPAQEEALLEHSVAGAWKQMQSTQPEVYTVCPTLACNLACAYCFEGDSLTDKKQGVMTKEQVTHLFHAIGGLRRGLAEQEHASPYPPLIALFGGEPLLPSTRACVADILAQAAASGFLVGATTNGVNLVHYESLLTEYADILTNFQVTLDGPKAVHDRRRHRLGGQGTFDEIARGVDLLLFLGIDVDLRVNIDASNLLDLPELVTFLDERGWTGHPGFRLALAPVTNHSGTGPNSEKGCGATTMRAFSEMEMAQGVMALMEKHPRLAEVCHLGFLRHLDYLVSVLEPEKHKSRQGGVGPRYWYCEASTDKQFVFTPEGLIYSCTEAVGKPRHAIGRFDPVLDLWRPQAQQWQGRTILSHPKCRSCSISTLCGGGCNFAAREPEAAGALMQISLPGGRPAVAERTVEPFCNAAEETVRAYLRYAGPNVLSRSALLSNSSGGALPLSLTGLDFSKAPERQGSATESLG